MVANLWGTLHKDLLQRGRTTTAGTKVLPLQAGLQWGQIQQGHCLWCGDCWG